MKRNPVILMIIAFLLLALLSGCNTVLPESTDASPEFDEPVIKIGELGSTHVYIDEKSGAIFSAPRFFTIEEQEAIDEKIAQYKTVIANHPGLNYYAFYLELIQYSEHNPVNDEYPGSDGGQGLEYFIANKPAELTLSTLPLNSFNDHEKYYFRTDHHWNVHGVLAGYKTIYKMLAKNYRDISSMFKPVELHTFEDIEFIGTWARELDFETPPETFTVAVYDLPSYTVYDSSGNELSYRNKDAYFSGEYGDDIYTDHYIDYYGADDVGYLQYVSQNGSERNLLIIGDSFTNAIEPLLASHYHNTYAIDIRRLPDNYFSMSEFLAEHDVDDVLMLGGGDVIFFTRRWTINP